VGLAIVARVHPCDYWHFNSLFAFKLFADRYDERIARLITDHTGLMPSTYRVIGQQDIARAELSFGAITDLELHAS
jgi:hypothetical protein